MPVLFRRIACFCSALAVAAALSACATDSSGSASALRVGQRLNERLYAASNDRNPVALAVELIETIDANPDVLPQLEYEGIEALLDRLEEVGDGATEAQVLSTLIDADWRPFDGVVLRSNIFDRRLTLRYLELGDTEAARAAAREVWQANQIIEMLVDRRYEPVWNDIESVTGGDAAAALRREIAELEALRTEHPDRLRTIYALINALMRAGLDEEAVMEGEATLARLDESNGAAFSDTQTYVTWFLDAFAFAYAHLNEMDQAHSIFEAASRYPQSYQTARGSAFAANVSQTINGAGLLVLDGHSQEALERLDGLSSSNTSAYGSAAVLSIRICAAEQLGDADTRNALLETLLERREDAPNQAWRALLCTERLEDAAQLMVWSLENEDARRAALLEAQNFAETQYVYPFLAIRDARARAVFDDPRVRAAIDRFGRVRTWNVGGVY